MHRRHRGHEGGHRSRRRRALIRMRLSASFGALAAVAFTVSARPRHRSPERAPRERPRLSARLSFRSASSRPRPRSAARRDRPPAGRAPSSPRRRGRGEARPRAPGCARLGLPPGRLDRPQPIVARRDQRLERRAPQPGPLHAPARSPPGRCRRRARLGRARDRREHDERTAGPPDQRGGLLPLAGERRSSPPLP